MRSLRTSKAILTGAFTAVVLFSLVPAGASSANISHSYHSVTTIKNGSLVSLDPERSDYVLPSNTDNASRLLGVAVASDDSLLAVDPTDGQIQVAINGNANALVSTLNGDVAVGDQIAASPFNGVGMKAEPGSHIIGLAQTTLNKGTAGSSQQTITDKSGRKHEVTVGFVRVSISVSTANIGAQERINSLQRVAKSLTGRTISTARVIVALVVVVVALIALITLIYASIYGSIISIGRNPLAKYAVFRTLSSVMMMVGLIAVIATLTVFLLLH